MSQASATGEATGTSADAAAGTATATAHAARPPEPRPDTYRALVCSHLSGDLSGVGLQTLPMRAPAPDQVRVRIRAAALNFPDLLMTEGKYQLKPPLPFVMGLEAAGEVAEVGSDVTGWSVGDRVLVHRKTGAFAEQALVQPNQLRKIPGNLDFARAAAFPASAITAYVSLVCRANLQPGETLLVHGASGGVGMGAVRLGRHLGATVIATGTSAAKLDVVRAHGAHHVLNLADGFREQVKDLTGGRGANVIFDPVGGDVFDESLRCIAWDGRLLVIGFAGGRIPVLPVNIALIKGFSVMGVRAGEYGRQDPAKGAANLKAIDRLADEGVFSPYVGARFPLSHAMDALACLAERRVAGKIVLEP